MNHISKRLIQQPPQMHSLHLKPTELGLLKGGMCLKKPSNTSFFNKCKSNSGMRYHMKLKFVRPWS